MSQQSFLSKLGFTIFALVLIFLFELLFSKLRRRMFSRLMKRADEKSLAKFKSQEQFSNKFFKVGYSLGAIVVILLIWFGE